MNTAGGSICPAWVGAQTQIRAGFPSAGEWLIDTSLAACHVMLSACGARRVILVSVAAGPLSRLRDPFGNGAAGGAAAPLPNGSRSRLSGPAATDTRITPVSYTHLTLPTKR